MGRVCEHALSHERSTRWRVTNNSLSGHLPCIEAPARQGHIRPVPQLVAAVIVTIRIYNYAAVPAEQLAAARAAADGIFQETGISLQWIDCRVPGAAMGAACAGPLGEREFVLRLLESPNPNSNPNPSSSTNPNHDKRLALGRSLLDVETHGGVLITIDPARTAAVAAQAGANSTLVLGRAMAHELGHMLLGTPRHADTGLMRAVWSQRELRENTASDWHFSLREAGAMRHGLAVRTGAAN
jgi:hypothetical protein